MDGQLATLEQLDFILDVKCSEPDGEVVRFVRPMLLDLDKLEFLWNTFKEYDVLFNDWVDGDFKAFINHFLRQENGELVAAGLMWEVDDVGMFYLNEIKPAVSATAHFVFWDLRFRGREDLCREMVKYVFEKYQFQRIEVRVPLYATKTLRAVSSLGFVQEGRIRGVAPYKGDMYDMMIFSTLPGEFDDLPEGDLGKRENRRQLCGECGTIYTEEKS